MVSVINRILQWILTNKLSTFLIVLSFALFISTVTLAAQRNGTLGEVAELQAELEAALAATSTAGPTVVTTVVTVPPPTEEPPPEEINYRLPSDVIPSHYDLLLNPNLETDVFQGVVTITVDVLNPTDSITLHTNGLEYTSTSVVDTSGAEISHTYEIIADDRQFFILTFQNILPAATYHIDLAFTGRLDNGITGFYASQISTGSKMAASKFQPTYARQAFPCFDEPDLKATFDIRLVAPSTHQALSNMDELSSETNTDGTTTVRFATSVPMSTYLAVFVVSDFVPTENLIETGGIGFPFTLQSFARSDQQNKVTFAQDIGKRCTEFYIQYYKVAYPLPKLDMIAIPDYVSGATEHWGLITYRETSFLIDEESSSSVNKRNVANTIAHELAHMWFGNLVTMKWWDEVWLNEGFASYMQVKALNAIEPSWTMLDQFLTRTMHSVLRLDATVGSHPIVQLVTTPDEITAIFDTISYNKGASILRMLEGFVGEDDFQNGVSDYLTAHALGNTVTEDLLNSLDVYFGPKNLNLDLKHIMATWTQQMGFPLITVAQGSIENEYILTQSRHLADNDAVVTEESEFNYRWYVPITYKSAQGVNTEILWFPDTAETVTLTLPSNSFWLKLNNDQVGFYRVNYPLTMWQNLIDQLTQNAQNSLTISDRAHLIDDVYELAFARVVSYELALDLTKYLESETQYVPWVAASSKFALVRRYLLNSPAYADFNQFTSSVIKPVYDNVVWTQNSEDALIEKLERMIIISEACDSGLAEAQTEARTRFVAWLDSHDTTEPLSIDPDLRDIVYVNGMLRATMSDWDKLWQIYLNEDDAQEKTKLRTALGAPQDVTILRKYINLAWDSSNVRDQDYLTVMGSISSNPSGTALVWDYYRENWQGFIDKFTLNSRTLGSFITTITNSFSTNLRLQEMEAFFAANPDAGAGASARVQALENVRNNILWTQYNEPLVRAWLTNFLATSAK